MYIECDENIKCPFYEFVYYPVMANLNLQCMWLDTTYNHFLADIGASKALMVADKVVSKVQFDKQLVDDLHNVYGGKWYGMGLSEHIGFKNWNEEECRNPVIHTFKPSNKARIIAVIPENATHSEGSVWTKKELVLPTFLRYDDDIAYIDLYATSMKDAGFKITQVSEGLKVNVSEGIVKGGGVVRLEVTKEDMLDTSIDGHIHIHGEYMEQDILVPFAKPIENDELANNTFIFNDDYICIEAGNYASRKKGEKDSNFEEIKGFGKMVSGMKAFPIDKTYVPSIGAPSVSYDFYIREEGVYEVTLYTSPSNPPYRDNKLYYGQRCNDDKIRIENVIPSDFEVTDGNDSWQYGPLNNERKSKFKINCKQGKNTLTFYAYSPQFVIEKIVIAKENAKVDYAYFGPRQTMYVK